MKGTFILSIDVELAWGFVARVKIDEWCLKAAGKVREILDPLLRIVGDYEIPVTWAVVGHLFLSGCRPA